MSDEILEKNLERQNENPQTVEKHTVSTRTLRTKRFRKDNDILYDCRIS